MEIFDALKRDHEKVKELLQRIAKAEGRERGRLFGEFRAQILAHSHAEERVLYNAMKKEQPGREAALEGIVEHQVVERLVEELEAGRSKSSDEWLARLTVVKELLEHHIEEEESEIFAKARKMFRKEQLQKMQQQFERAKERELQAA